MVCDGGGGGGDEVVGPGGTGAAEDEVWRVGVVPFCGVGEGAGGVGGGAEVGGDEVEALSLGRGG